MLLFQFLLGIATFIVICLLLGEFVSSENIKKNILSVLSVIYNAVLGYIHIISLVLLYAFFSGHPKGNAYYISEEEASFNVMIGIVLLIIYLLLLIPINIFFYRNRKVSSKVHIIINILATIIGVVIYWIFIGSKLI